MSHNSAIFTPLLLGALTFFAWSLYRRLSLITLGQSGVEFRGFVTGLREMFVYAFLQKRVLREGFGFNHLVIFWAFMTLIFVNVEFMVNGVFPSLRLSILPNALYFPIRFLSDVMAALTFVAVVLALIRRTIVPPFAQARSLEAYVILFAVCLHVVAFITVSACEIALGHEHAAAYMPVSAFISGLLARNPTPRIEAIFDLFWWLHAVAIFIFILVLIPFTKHLHVLTAIANCFFKRQEKPNTQPREEFRLGNRFGVSQVDHFSWKDLLDPLACTQCGRCQNVCPAGITGKPLNPRGVIQDIKVNLLKNGPLLKKGLDPEMPLIGSGGAGSCSEEVIWACTTCGACMEACPVFIEQMPKIILMRRHLVESESRFPEELLNLFENMEARSNPWGIAPTERAKWCATMDVKPFDKDATEYLFYVGCAGSLDSRSKHVTVAMAQLLDKAGITWGILGKDERCCGDSVRRLGNEFLFDKMAMENVTLFRERGVRKVIAQCPHCFTTLKNDYRQYGLELEVIHHSELLNSLLQEGRLKLDAKSEEFGAIVFHDSCYLGRHNDIYEAPRKVIEAATGGPPAEMRRNLERSFCCGAGGGRMWMEEQTGERINRARVREALEEKPDTICVSCPYCMTMFEDGLKDAKSAGVRVLDLAEIMAEAVLR